MTPIEAKTIREALGLTQVALARILGVSNMTVSKWERGIQTPGDDNTAILTALLPMTAKEAAELGTNLRQILVTQGHLAARVVILRRAVTDMGRG